MAVKKQKIANRLKFAEQYRPQLHFSPQENWMNDPNGLVYFRGTYHLFYQYNPTGDTWGNMHWAHASSEDLVHWRHHPIAIFPGEGSTSYVFSGGAVVDFNNSSGLAQEGDQPPLIAFFTHSGEDCEDQRQCIAYSTDSGETWVEYEGNPILPNPGLKDFRDPKVCWDASRQQWVMSLACGQKVQFFCSNNLLDWNLASEFGPGIGHQGGVWECPDLFELTAGNGEKRHILIVSINPGGPHSGSGTQYFVGKFDGKVFLPDYPESQWLDFGMDNYAGITWEAAPNELDRRLFIAWMSNWQYANQTPTSPWRGQMTFVRSLELKALSRDRYVLCQKPVEELDRLHTEASEKQRSFAAKTLTAGQRTSLIEVNLSDIQLRLMADDAESICVIRYYNTLGERLEIRVDFGRQKYVLDRSHAGIDRTGKDFSSAYEAPFIQMNSRELDMRIIKDSSSVECFVEGGLVSMTSLFYPTANLDLVEIESVGGQIQVDVSCMEMASIWT